MKNANGLTDQQQRFADEYAIDLNGKQAAIRAGYKPKSAEVTASRLLSKIKVRAYVEKRLAEASKRTGINIDRVLREYARIAFVKPSDVADFESASLIGNARDDDLAAVSSIKVRRVTGKENIEEREIKFFDKTKALDSLSKYLGMFADNRDSTADAEVVDKLDEMLKTVKKAVDDGKDV